MSVTLTDDRARIVVRAFRDRLRDKHPGVATLAMSGWTAADGHDYVCLDMLILDPAHRRQGTGSAIMRDILTEADANGWTLCLTPCPIGARPLPKDVLVGWYRSFGFLPNKGHRRDWNTMEDMVRPAGPIAKGVSY